MTCRNLRLQALFQILFCGLMAAAGTAVGNFNYKNQISFDFRIGYPSDWTWQQEPTATPEEQERWSLSNLHKVSDASHLSFAKISFLNDFPAANDEELLQELIRRHPGLQWKTLQNPDFTVGYVSDQVFQAPGRTQNFEYYFSAKHKVVRIESWRDTVENGAAELDAILKTVRRPSGAPRLLSISLQGNTSGTVKVGEQICYRLEVDPLQTDFDSDSVGEFEIQGAPSYWSFKSIAWNRLDSSLSVCFKINSHFAVDGLVIKKLTLESHGGALLYCSALDGSAKSSDHQLSCGGQTLSYRIPAVENSSPATQAPQIKNVQLGSAPHSLRLSVIDSVPLSSGQIVLESASNGRTPDSQIIYEDQLRSSDFEVTFDPDRLPPGFTRVLEIKLIDQVGNAVKLKADGGDSTYTLYSSDKSPQPTSFSVLSLVGDPP